MQIDTNKEHKKLDLTIVIPTFERQFIIKNLIDFYKNKPYQVLILDGSKTSMKCIFPSNVNYIWSGKSYQERLTSSLKHIETNFVCMVGDDEFHFLDALKKSLKFLERNKNYSSCSGYPVSHQTYSRSRIRKITGLDSFFSSTLKKHPYRFENNCYANLNISRLKQHFNDYQPRFVYSMTRTKIWNAAINSMNIAVSQGFGASSLYECMIEYSIIGAGPVHLIDMPMWYRSPLIMNSGHAENHDLSLNPKLKCFQEVWPDFPQTKKLNLVNQLKCEIPSVDYEYIIESFDIYSKNTFKRRNRPRNKIYLNKIYSFLRKFNSLKKLCFTVLILICLRYKKELAIAFLSSGMKISINSKHELKNYLNLITKNL